MEGANFNFINDHASTFDVQSLHDYWYATGGQDHQAIREDPLCATAPNGEHSFTYPPEINVSGDVAREEWGIPLSCPEDSVRATTH